MKLGYVIGRVTLSVQEPSYKGGRFLLIQPLTKAQAAGGPILPMSKANTLVAYDRLGAGQNDLVGYSESGEASAVFTKPTPVDAYCIALIDKLTYQPPQPV